MGSISKIQKLSEEQNVKKCEDRISNLPCNLIGRILSFLPTKFAVATCVLSTKWKRSWTSIDSLVFDDKLVLNPQQKERTPSLRRSFTSFVYRVLLLRRVSHLYKFHLECSQSYHFSHVNAWVTAAVLSNVQELDLSIRTKHSTVLPQDLFSCGTLVVLKLDAEFVMNVPTSIYLPNLKTLHLHYVKFLDDSIDRLICGCPVLEELSMRECVGNDVYAVNILAPALTSLVINDLAYDDRVVVSKHKIVLDTPALQYLVINDWIAEGYSVINLCHLVEADIGIVQGNRQESDYSEAITVLLKVISNVQILHLCVEFMEAIHYNDCQLPNFNNLTYLEIGASMDVGVVLALLPKLLENSPRLGTLVFNEGLTENYLGQHFPQRWNPPQSVPSCLLFHLKEIEIRGFAWYSEEKKMVEYFLTNAKLLEKVTMRYSSSHGVWTAHITP